MGIEAAGPLHPQTSAAANTICICTDFHAASKRVMFMLAQQNFGSAQGYKLHPNELVDFT